MSLDIKNLANSYQFETELPGTGETIKFKPISTGTMKKALMYENEEDIESLDNFLDELITDCTIDEKFNIDKLFLQDRFYLLVEIRKKSKGNVFKFSYRCKECDTDNIVAINLDELKITTKNNELKKSISINDKLSVHFKHITRGMQKEAFNKVPKELPFNRRMADIADYLYASAMTKFVSAGETDENVSLEDKIDLLNSIPETVYKKITQWFIDNDFGVDFTYKYKCIKPSCKSKERVINIPLTDFFA